MRSGSTRRPRHCHRLATPWRLALALCLAALCSGCLGTEPAPDLSQLYDRAASHHGPERNPVVVIPGVLGTRLRHQPSDELVWGAFFGGSLVDVDDAEGAHMIALPMRPETPLVELRDDVVPSGVLDTLKIRLIGLPFDLEAYVRILTTLGIGGYRDEQLAGSIDYGDGHFTCFQFEYDWRRDNVETARALHDFLLEKRDLVAREIHERFGVETPQVKFDVIAHSMGSLPLRYLLRYGPDDLPDDGSEPVLDWQGAELIERAILVAPPNLGAVDSQIYLAQGRRFAVVGPNYPAPLLGTYPALYQLLPRPRHRAILDRDGAPIDVYDPEAWQRHGWGLAASDADETLEKLLPTVDTPETRQRIALDHLEKSLNRARRFAAALDRPASPPEGLGIHLFAGDAEPTARVAQLDARGRLRIVEHDWGDEQVLRSSALADERMDGRWTPSVRTPIGWSHVSFFFQDHLGITRDPNFADNLLFLLLESPRGAVGE